MAGKVTIKVTTEEREAKKNLTGILKLAERMEKAASKKISIPFKAAGKGVEKTLGSMGKFGGELGKATKGLSGMGGIL